jgi:hypothetical protein
MAREVTITIDEQAKVTVDTAGYHGKGCAAVIEGFAKAAGASSAGMIKKVEYNAPAIAANRLKQ